MFFVTGALGQMTALQAKNQLMSAFSYFRETLTDTRAEYPQSVILYDHSGSTSGYDVVLFYRQNPNLSYQWVLLWVSNVEGAFSSLRLDPPDAATLYGKKQFVFDKLSSAEVSDLLAADAPTRQNILFGSTPGAGRDISDALIIEGIYPLSFDAERYMSGRVIESQMDLMGVYFSARANDPLSNLDLDPWRVFVSF